MANDEVKAQFNVSNMHIVMMDRDMDSKQKKKMMEEIGNVKGVKSTISMSSLLGPTIPESMIPENLRSMLQSDEYELAFVSSEYESATDEVNEQVKAIDKIVKSYDKNGRVIGEAPLMKDLQDVTDADLVNVNVLSIGAIFIIILLIFKSISLPIILVAIDYAKKCITAEKVIHPSGDLDKDMREIKLYYKNFKGKYPENFSIGKVE